MAESSECGRYQPPKEAASNDPDVLRAALLIPVEESTTMFAERGCSSR